MKDFTFDSYAFNKYLKVTFVATCITLLSIHAFAQSATPPGSPSRPKGNGRIVGVLLDSTNQKPVSFGTVALISTDTNKPVDGTISDEFGKFEISKIGAGEYALEYSFVGYKTLRTKPFKMAKDTELNVEKVTLSPDAKLLEEVTVLGMQDLVEQKVDRLVYNAEKDVMAKGGDAADVLRKVPMLTVDLDGNISLKGSQNVKVLINNKPSTISANSIASALKQIPANIIKSVEVITSPSAKYDAEGSAGIINIITKRNSLQGATLSTDMGVGNRGANVGLNGSYKKGKLGLTLGGFLWSMYNVKGDFNNTQTSASSEGIITTIQSAGTKNKGAFGSYQFGLDYDIDSTSYLTGSIRYGVMNMYNSQNNLLTQTFLPGAAESQNSNRNVDVKDLSGTVDASLTYTKIYKPSRELSVMGLYSRNNRTNSFISELMNNDNADVIGGLRNNNPSYNQESTLQIDYQTPIGKNQLVEVGAKGIYRNVNSDYKYLVLVDGVYVSNGSNTSNRLNYNQSVTAAYLSHTLTTNSKYSFKTGLRYEYTMINAAFKDGDESAIAGIADYGVIVPSINVSKDLGKGRTIKAGYNRRIQRPGIQFLNPNTNTSNPNNITVGNPYLSPELTDNIEVGMSGQVKAFFVNATLFGRATGKMITSVRDTVSAVVNGETTKVISTSYANIGKEHAVGLNVSTNATLFNKWQIGFGGTMYQTYLRNNDPALKASNSGFVISGFIFTGYNLGAGWNLQGFGGGRGKQIQLQGYQGSFAFYSLGIKKDLKNKKGSFGISAENIFNHPFKIRTEVSSAILSQNSVTGMYNAGIRANFSYRLGKMNANAMGGRKKKSIKNDDVKGAGEDNSNTGNTPR